MENQLCRVCEEPAAGFHFGAFTCEGCKSFFGRFCNNQTTIPDCKNSYKCVIDKRNRTSCKACRLRKCLAVGMSKSGCRYGRRSNWFKIHCLMQKNATAAAAAGGGKMMGKSMDMSVSPPPQQQQFMMQQPNSSPTLLPRAALPTGLPTFTSSTGLPTFNSSTGLPTFNSAAVTQPISISTGSRTPTPPMDPYNLHHTASSSLHSASPVQPPSPLSSSASPTPSLPHSPPLTAASPFNHPLFDPLALYRLSPLFALQNAAFAANTATPAFDFHDQLRLLAQRRALYEASCALTATSPAVSQSEDCKPIDLSVK